MKTGHYIHEPFEPASSLFAVWVYSSWRNAWFNSGYMLRVSSWCFWKVFFVKENSNPEVDSRPAPLGPRFYADWRRSVHNRCFRFSELLHFEISTLCPRALRIWQSVAHCFSFASEEFFLCQTEKGWRGRRGLDSQVTCHQLVSETHCSVVLCGHTHRSSKPAFTTTNNEQRTANPHKPTQTHPNPPKPTQTHPNPPNPHPTTNQPPTKNQPTTNQQPTNNQPTTNQQPTNNQPTNNRPTTDQPTTDQQPTNNRPTTDQQPTNNRPTTDQPQPTTNQPQPTNYQQTTNKLPTNYQQTTNKLPTKQHQQHQQHHQQHINNTNNTNNTTNNNNNTP